MEFSLPYYPKDVFENMIETVSGPHALEGNMYFIVNMNSWTDQCMFYLFKFRAAFLGQFFDRLTHFRGKSIHNIRIAISPGKYPMQTWTFMIIFSLL